jgi:hypothetical protein
MYLALLGTLHCSQLYIGTTYLALPTTLAKDPFCKPLCGHDAAHSGSNNSSVGLEHRGLDWQEYLCICNGHGRGSLFALHCARYATYVSNNTICQPSLELYKTL